LLVYRRIGGAGDTTLVSDWTLTPSATQVQVASEGTTTLTFSGARDGARVTLEYRFLPASTASGCADGWRDSAPPAPRCCWGWGTGCGRRGGLDGRFPALRRRHQVDEDATHGLRVGQAGERKILDGPFEWTGVKSKYFFAAALAVEDNQQRFGAAIVEGGPRTVSTSGC